MITRKLLNKLGKAKAEEHYASTFGKPVSAKESYAVATAFWLDLLFPGVEALEFYARINHLEIRNGFACPSIEDSEIIPTIVSVPSIIAQGANPIAEAQKTTLRPGKVAREFLAKLEREIDGKHGSENTKVRGWE